MSVRIHTVARLLARCYTSLRVRPAPPDAIVVTGVARSGTTWLLALLGTIPDVQTIFEPLNPHRIAEMQRRAPPRGPGPFTWSPYLRPEECHPEWDSFLERVLTGRIRNGWTDLHGTRPFARRFVIKLVRGSLMLGYLYDTFHPSLIYLVRHPCAVVASRLALGWRSEVRDLLDQPALVENYLAPWESQIARERDEAAIHAIWWAVENLVAASDLAPRPHHSLFYESLCLDPWGEMSAIFNWLEVEMPASLPEAIERPSLLSRADVRYNSVQERLSQWRRELTSAQQRKILEWVHRLGCVWYGEELLPALEADERPRGMAGLKPARPGVEP